MALSTTVLGQTSLNVLRSTLRAAAVSGLAVIVAGSLANVTPADAQTIQQALTQAYRTNPQIDAQRAAQRATDEGVARAHSGYRPNITGNASSSWTRTDSQPPVGATQGESHPRTFGFDITQPIFRGFRTLNDVRRAEAEVRAGRELLRSTEQTVLLQAATAYMDIVRDQATIRIRENNVKVLTNQLKATRDQFAAGEVTRTDVAQAEARLAESIAELEVARGTLRASRGVYERIVGSPPGPLTDPGEPSRLMPKTLPEATGIASRENPLIVQALYLEQSARYNIDVARSALLPTINLTANYTRSFDSPRTVDQSDARTIRTNMTVPIYSNGDVEAQVRGLKHTHVQRIQQIEDARTRELALVVGAWARYSSAKAQGISTAAAIRANQTALTGVREEYRVGQRTLLDVLNAEQALLNSQLGEINARRTAIVEAYTLLQTIGRLSASEMALGAEIYDPEIHYFEVRRKWFGLSITHASGRQEKVDSSWEPVTHKPTK